MPPSQGVHVQISLWSSARYADDGERIEQTLLLTSGLRNTESFLNDGASNIVLKLSADTTVGGISQVPFKRALLSFFNRLWHIGRRYEAITTNAQSSFAPQFHSI